MVEFNGFSVTPVFPLSSGINQLLLETGVLFPRGRCLERPVLGGTCFWWLPGVAVYRAYWMAVQM